MTRETERRAIFGRAMASVNEKNLREVGDSHFMGMPRKERRALARAYAAKAWRERSAQKAAA